MDSVISHSPIEKTKVVSITTWAFIINFLISSGFAIQGAIKDYSLIAGDDSSMLLLIFSILSTSVIVCTPIIFSIGTLFRKNWGRIGIMLICILNIGLNSYSMFLMKAFYPQQTLWMLFYLVVLVTFSSAKYKKEFINRS
jgi:hypothetical protein